MCQKLYSTTQLVTSFYYYFVVVVVVVVVVLGGTGVLAYRQTASYIRIANLAYQFVSEKYIPCC